MDFTTKERKDRRARVPVRASLPLELAVPLLSGQLSGASKEEAPEAPFAPRFVCMMFFFFIASVLFDSPALSAPVRGPGRGSKGSFTASSGGSSGVSLGESSTPSPFSRPIGVSCRESLRFRGYKLSGGRPCLLTASRKQLAFVGESRVALRTALPVTLSREEPCLNRVCALAVRPGPRARASDDQPLYFRRVYFRRAFRREESDRLFSLPGPDLGLDPVGWGHSGPGHSGWRERRGCPLCKGLAYIHPG
jgi:hypothetical protein